MLRTVKFTKDTPERLADGSLTQQVSYTVDGEEYTYQAFGEDLDDLERDWAYQYLEIVRDEDSEE